MGHRPHVYVSIKLPADGGVSPNLYVRYVTAEIRLFYPPHQVEVAERALMQAVSEAWRQFEEQTHVEPAN